LVKGYAVIVYPASGSEKNSGSLSGEDIEGEKEKKD
jgi:hypothetical protein